MNPYPLARTGFRDPKRLHERLAPIKA
jgi:hypothetical protein